MGECYTGLLNLCPVGRFLPTHMPQSRLLHTLCWPGWCRAHLYGRCHWTYRLSLECLKCCSKHGNSFHVAKAVGPHPGSTRLRCPHHCFCHVLQVQFINTAATRLGPAAAYAHGAHMVLLDGIGLGVGMLPQVGAGCMPCPALAPLPWYVACRQVHPACTCNCLAACLGLTACTCPFLRSASCGLPEVGDLLDARSAPKMGPLEHSPTAALRLALTAGWL